MSITSVPKTQFGEKLRGLRVALKQTQDTVGAAAGVTGGAISKWELGVAFPNRMYLKRLCGYFGVMLSYFGLESMGEADVNAIQAPAAVEKQLATDSAVHQVGTKIHNQAADTPSTTPATVAQAPVMQPQGALPEDVQAAIDTILRMPWDAQDTVVTILRLSLEKTVYEKRLLIQMSAGGRK